jgi:hypothetical protein
MKPIIPTVYLSLVSLLTLSAGITSAQALPNFERLQGLSTSESLISQANPPAEAPPGQPSGQPPMSPPGQPSVPPAPEGPPPAAAPTPPPASNSNPSADSKPGSSKNDVGCVVRFRHSPCALRLRESPQS